VRGGVSISSARCSSLLESSPRAWGCFRGGRSRHERRDVFPTCVGVFRTHCVDAMASVLSSPRAWGCF